MHEKPLCLLSMVLVAGCATPRLLLPGSSYRLTETAVLLPPPLANAASQAGSMRLSLGPSRSRCEAVRGSFSLRAIKGQWVLEMPGPGWWAQRGAATVEAETRPFLDAVRECLPPKSAEQLRRSLLDSFPGHSSMSLYFTYGFPSAEGMVDLRPGMGLKIERVRREQGKYAGTSVEHYAVERGIRVVRSTPGGRELPARTRAARLYRLHLFTNLVKQKRQRAATLVGAPDSETLARVSAELVKNPEALCSELPRGWTECRTFEGLVSVSPEMGVSVNGATKYFPIGLSVRAAIPNANPAALRIRRRFQESMVAIDFSASDSGILALPMAAGDEIVSW